MGNGLASSSEYAELRDLLYIDQAQLNKEVSEHAEFYHRVCFLTAKAKAKVARCEREKSVTFNRLAGEKREVIVGKTARGPSKEIVDQAVRASTSYEDVCYDLIEAQEDLLKWEALESAWAARGFTLRDAVKLALAKSMPSYIRDEQPIHRSLDSYRQDKVDTTTDVSSARKRHI